MASSTIPEKFLDLLTTKKPLANIATVMPDGSPQVTPVWFDYTNGKIRINTARGRVKANNMKVGSKVALAIVDPDNAYRYIGIRGPVISEDEKMPTRTSTASRRSISTRTSTRSALPASS